MPYQEFFINCYLLHFYCIFLAKHYGILISVSSTFSLFSFFSVVAHADSSGYSSLFYIMIALFTIEA